nr:dynamin family protein [Actinomycetota bacterium]
MADSSNPLPGERIRGLVSDVLAELQGVGLPADAERVTAELQLLATPSPAAVLVVGETKRGKSSLINALIGAPELSPVDVGVATAVAVEISYWETPAATVFYEGGPADGQSIPVEQLADWASTWGNPDNDKEVTLVRAWWPSPLLKAGLDLIDTPGVGGLDPVHRKIALHHLRHADALLFVLDSSAPISRPEVDFLKEARERVESVQIVMTKTDNHPSWRTVADESSALLEEVRIRGVDGPLQIYPVSSATARLAQQLESLGDEEGARVMRADSGLPRLERALIDEVAGRRQWIRLMNLCRVTDGALEAGERLVADVLSTAAGDTSATASRKDEVAAIQHARRDTNRWESLLAEAFGSAANVLVAHVTAAETSLRSGYEHRITVWKPEMAGPLAATLDSDLRALTLEIAELSSTEFATVTVAVAGE